MFQSPSLRTSRSAIYVPDNLVCLHSTTASIYDSDSTQSRHSTDLAPELVYRDGMPLARFPYQLDSAVGNDCDAVTDCTCPSSAWSSDDSSSLCSIEQPTPITLEQEFIQAIGRTFSLPVADLDWLRGMDEDLYDDPLEALFQSIVEPPAENEQVDWALESFLEVRKSSF